MKICSGNPKRLLLGDQLPKTKPNKEQKVVIEGIAAVAAY